MFSCPFCSFKHDSFDIVVDHMLEKHYQECIVYKTIYPILVKEG